MKWVVHSLVTVFLWGIWGALAGLSAQHGFPDTLVYCVWSLTMIPPALWVLARNGWKLDVSGRAVAYGLTIGLNIQACYYRPDHFREAGLDPDRFPTTMEELVRVGEKLNRFDRSGNLTRIGFMPKDFRHMAPIFGGGFYDWERGFLTIKTPENQRALTFLAEEREKLGFQNVVRYESGLSINNLGIVARPPHSGGHAASQPSAKVHAEARTLPRLGCKKH